MTGATLRPGQADLPSARSTASYWHREPSEVLLGHRTTKALPPTADVVVVGSGITGAFAAKELLEQQAGKGKRVLLLEAREVCWGATGRNGGHCQPVSYNPNTAIADFELRNYAYLADLVAANAIPCDWVPLRGVHALLTPDLVAAAEKQIAALPPRLAGLARLVTDPEELKTLRVASAAGAVVQERAASVWPYKLVAWILEDLLRRFGLGSGSGAEAQSQTQAQSDWGWFNIQTNTPVTRLQHLAPSPSSSGEASWIIHTDRGQVATSQVLLASNAYTSRLLPAFADLIVPVRGQVAALIPPEPRAELGRSYVFMASSDSSRGEPNQDDYLIQRPSPGLEMILGGGRARGTLKGVGVSDDDEIDPVVAAYLRRAGATNVDLGGQGGKELRASYEWTGIMAFSRDGRPWVGPVPSGAVLGGGDGLWVCAGYTGHGMPQAALCGRAVAGMMTGSAGGGHEAVGLPAEFLVGEERAEKARDLPSIKEMDDLDMFLL